jgi:hypothetical protein
MISTGFDRFRGFLKAGIAEEREEDRRAGVLNVRVSGSRSSVLHDRQKQVLVMMFRDLPPLKMTRTRDMTTCMARRPLHRAQNSTGMMYSS